ncbi:hypothetical protein [Asanoa siamensis]|uniref:hypothetical protein n=1 Tax=Asanoa siamensis TaxID=926357 RepID=UPI0019447677|nr:hypothetical protein [Asanoa siamensis]
MSTNPDQVMIVSATSPASTGEGVDIRQVWTITDGILQVGQSDPVGSRRGKAWCGRIRANAARHAEAGHDQQLGHLDAGGAGESA